MNVAFRASAPPFTAIAVRHGARDGLAVGASMMPWGFTFGLLAQQALSFLQTLAMSGYVFSGTAQFVALDLWQQPLSISALLFAVAAINARYLLQGATLAPWLAGMSSMHRLGTLFFLSDASWAMSLKRFERGDADIGYLFGSSAVIYTGWLVSSIAGYAIPLPSASLASWGLDFAVTAALIGLAGGRWTGRSDVKPWVVAALTALATHALVEGNAYMLTGGVAGAIAGALRNERAAD